MQKTNSGASRIKRPKPRAPEPEVSDSAASESIPGAPPVENSISSEGTTDDFLITESAVLPSTEIEALEAFANEAHRLYPDEILSLADKEPVDQQNEDYIPGLNHDEGMDLLEGYFSDSPLD
jgi:hypothetical protein